MFINQSMEDGSAYSDVDSHRTHEPDGWGFIILVLLIFIVSRYALREDK